MDRHGDRAEGRFRLSLTGKILQEVISITASTQYAALLV